MALSKCKECGKKVSSTAKKCPHCGVKKPVAAPAPGAFESIFGIIVVVGLLWWWFYDPEPEAGTEQTRQVADAVRRMPILRSEAGYEQTRQVADINKYVSGKKHGHWVERLSNSSMAEGPYVNGKRHGHWVVRSSLDKKYDFVREGPYVNGKRQGQWVERDAYGSEDKGPYVNDKRHGHWVYRFADGGVLEGPYVNGERHGQWVRRYPDGTVEVEVWTYREGKRERKLISKEKQK